MRRALLWLLGGVASFLLAAALLAPGGLVLRALGLTVVTLVPAIVLVVLAGDSRRRTHVFGGHTPDDPDPDGDR